MQSQDMRNECTLKGANVNGPLEPARFITSIRGNRVLVDKFNYIYHKNNCRANRTYWNCSKLSEGCKARALTTNDSIVKTTPHNHGADPAAVRIRKETQRVVEQAKLNPQLATASLVNEWKEATMGPSGPISKKSLERRVQRAKARLRNHPKTPKSFADLAKMPERYANTLDGDLFLLKNLQLESGERILIFCSDAGLETLANSSTWSADCSCWPCPDPFAQICTLLSEVGGGFYPCAFLMLPRAAADLLRGALEVIKEALVAKQAQGIARTGPDHLLTEFDASVIQELSEIFDKTTTKVSSCEVSKICS